jgi:hypothetical protein
MNNSNSLTTKQVFFLVITLVGIIFTPYLALYYFTDGNIPPDLFNYPPMAPQLKPQKDILAICISIAIGVVILLLYIFPAIFGFKGHSEKQHFHITKKYLPVWFWIGLILFLMPLILFCIQASEPKWIVNWGLIPLFWGFTFILDGIVFYINDGESLVSKNPSELISLGMISISGWLFFDYLNFFIKNNWYYPYAGIVDHGNHEFLIYATIGSSGFMPMAFEWYYLLRKIKILNTKYKNGPKINLSRCARYVLILIGTAALIAVTKYNDFLFFAIWVAPLVIIASVLSLLNIWTPFTPIKNGNWTALLTFALTYLIQGFLLEWWNYMSASHGNTRVTYNCAYWVYDLPYVNVAPIFEMPVFGYMGYLFFSIHCYIWWIALSKLSGVYTLFGDDDDFK